MSFANWSINIIRFLIILVAIIFALVLNKILNKEFSANAPGDISDLLTIGVLGFVFILTILTYGDILKSIFGM